ncbi:MAG: hypothetical protein KDB03_04830 [Planctomycetales bacterium]|nr:hypothetical protein [Planctomycetales bacterium]
MRTCLVFCLIISCNLLRNSVAADEVEKKITFDEHIKPIFREHCTTCHSESDKESDLALDSYGGALAGGSGGQVIKENDAGGSRLVALIDHAEGPFMPPDQAPIPDAQRAMIKTWVDQGMPENSGSKIRRKNTAAASMIEQGAQGRPEGPPPMPISLLKQPVELTPRSSAIAAMAASPWSPLIAVGGQRQVVLYHSETTELLGILPFPEGEPQSLSFTRDGRQLLIGGGRHSHSGCAVLVDIETGKRLSKVGDELDIVLATDISPDKRRIAIAGPQKIIRVFDTYSGEQLFEMKKHTDWIFTLRYSPDGVLLASGDRSNGLIVWEADTGRVYADLVGHKGEVRAVDFRPDSNVLLSASLDGTLKLWDMYESKEVLSISAHSGGATSAAFTQDGRIVSSGRDSKIKLWDANGKIISEFQGLSEAALEVAVTGNGQNLAGGDWNGDVRVWQANNPQAALPVSANPPSIEQRLLVARQHVDSLEPNYAKLSEQLEKLSQDTGNAKMELETATARVSSMEIRQTSLASDLMSVEAQIAEQNAEMERLALALELAQQRRNELVATAENIRQQQANDESELQQLLAARETANKIVNELQIKVEETAAKEAQQRQELELARVALTQAEADKI